MWIIITSVCSFLVLISFTMLCLCWRKKTQKNDLLGLDGLVTQKNPDENVNHLPSAIAQTVPDGIIINAAGDTATTASDANKSNKPVIINNPRRSLPDIPSDGVRSDGDIVTYEPNGDNSSDLYATVEPYQNSAKRHTLPNGLDARPSISQHSSISQADDTFSPYARVKDHPYDKLKMEHPYARVEPSTSQEQEENSSGEATPRNVTLRNERTSSGQTNEPIAPSRSRRSSGQSIEVDIPAASAVAGGIAANQELPYMTPPITQPNFSGDSQDSSKGYTSISVREPLANIRAQTKVLSKVQSDSDPHYSTVSDDSDDMYTTIQDPNNAIYTSGSETYAQIQPVQLTVEAEVNSNIKSEEKPPEENELEDQLHERAPQPPLSGLKHATHSHSRQASSSSSVGNLGSPKPEKRQANSPLPPPPPIPDSTLDLLTVDKPATCKNLDDMYAKVQKGRRKNDKDEQDRVSVLKENLQRKSTSSSGSNEDPKMNNEIHPEISISKESLFSEHNYETLRKSPRKTSNGDPGYEKLKPRENEFGPEPGYDTINGPDSILSTDPGYEVVRRSSEVSSEVDPNYEELRHRASSIGGNPGYTTIGNQLNVNHENNYSVVNKQSKQSSSSDEAKSKNSSSYESDGRDLSTDEPNYESMPSESVSEHNYALLKSTGSESDPNYESVNHNDPNYESVKYLDVSLEEPPYERFQDEDSSRSENVLSETTGELEVGYEKVQTDEKTYTKENSDADPGYETIKSEKLTTDTTDVNLESDYDGIVQV